MSIKAQARTNPNYGKPPGERNIEELLDSGVINLDKPSGPTSHQVTAWIQKIFGVKAGHGGTLDPKVTGVLPIALSNATKAIGIRVEKEYACIMRLHKDVGEKKIRDVCKKFVGEIYQIPPIQSAVKRKKRKRRIFNIDLLEIDGRDILFKVGCEAGTYIRTLCVDMGKEISCGAHMEELRRTKSGKFEEKNSVTLHDLLDSYIFWKENGIEEELRKIVKPMEFLLDHLPKIIIRDSAVDAICHGANLALPGILRIDDNVEKNDLVAIETLKGEGVALAKTLMSAKEILQKDRGIAANINRVLMNKGTYPPIWKKS